MKLIAVMLVTCFLLSSLISFTSATGESHVLTLPVIDVQCSLHDIHDTPPELEATVKFTWRATSANFVLIKGRDTQRHPLTGEFSKAHGGGFTFIAVSGNQKVRQSRTCYQSFRTGTGIHNLIWSVNEEPKNTNYMVGAGDFMMSTDGPTLKNRIIQLLRADFGVVAISTPSSKSNLLISTVDYGSTKNLCDLDGCKPDGKAVERQIGFDVMLEGTLSDGGKTRYQVRVSPDVLVRPVGEDGEWSIDPNSDKIGEPIAKALAARINEIAKQQ